MVLIGQELEEVEERLSRDLEELGALSQPPWSYATLYSLRHLLKRATDSVDALSER